MTEKENFSTFPCLWHQQFDGGEVKTVNGKPTCPRCGGELEVVHCAV